MTSPAAVAQISKQDVHRWHRLVAIALDPSHHPDSQAQWGCTVYMHLSLQDFVPCELWDFPKSPGGGSSYEYPIVWVTVGQESWGPMMCAWHLDLLTVQHSRGGSWTPHQSARASLCLLPSKDSAAPSWLESVQTLVTGSAPKDAICKMPNIQSLQTVNLKCSHITSWPLFITLQLASLFIWHC